MGGKLYLVERKIEFLYFSEDGSEPSQYDVPSLRDLDEDDECWISEYRGAMPSGWTGRTLVYGASEDMTVDEAIKRHNGEGDGSCD